MQFERHEILAIAWASLLLGFLAFAGLVALAIYLLA
jgi:hypothetical protein